MIIILETQNRRNITYHNCSTCAECSDFSREVDVKILRTVCVVALKLKTTVFTGLKALLLHRL